MLRKVQVVEQSRAHNVETIDVIPQTIVPLEKGLRHARKNDQW